MNTGQRRGLYAPELLEARIAPATFLVTNLLDAGDGSLRKAIGDANANPDTDTIKFGPAAIGTLPLSGGELVIIESVVIQGPGAEVLTIDAGGNSRIFKIADGSDVLKTVTISGLSLVNGSVTGSDGGGIFSTETLTLKKTVISGCQSTNGQGGGVAVNNTGNTGNISP
jgi:hypothetical protein